MKEIIVQAMPLLQKLITSKLPKKHLLELFSLSCNIQACSALPSRFKKDIVKEVMKKRVSWFDKADINPDDTYEEFIKSHGWFSISEDKKQLLVLSCVAVFLYNFCSLFNHNSSTFLNESEDQHPLSQVHLRIFHVSGVSTPVPTQLTDNAGDLTIRGNGDYFGAQIGTGVDRTLIHNFAFLFDSFVYVTHLCITTRPCVGSAGDTFQWHCGETFLQEGDPSWHIHHSGF